MKFEFLGPIKAYTDNNDEVNLLQRQHRLLLAVLVLAQGPLSLDQLELDGQLWDAEGDKPQNPRDRLYHLKKDLDSALTNAEPGFPRVVSRDGYYEIRLDRQQVDVFRFRDRAGDARRARAGRDDAHAVSLWRAAIAEWGPYRPELGPRGPQPLAGLTGMRAELLRNTLQGEYRTALTDCLAAELRLGRHAELIPELNALLNADDASTQDEELASLLMLAYYRSNQRDAALKTFRRLRVRLKEDGLTPSRKLELLHSRILSDDPALDLQDGAAMSSADASLGELPATDDMPSGADQIQPADGDGVGQAAADATKQAAADAGKQAAADARKADARKPGGQLFRDFFQLGENARTYIGDTQIFHEHTEDS